MPGAEQGQLLAVLGGGLTQQVLLHLRMQLCPLSRHCCLRHLLQSTSTRTGDVGRKLAVHLGLQWQQVQTIVVEITLLQPMLCYHADQIRSPEVTAMQLLQSRLAVHHFNQTVGQP